MLNNQVTSNRLHVLSAFASDQLDALKQARMDDFRLRQGEYQQEQANKEAEWTTRKTQCATAWKERRFLSLPGKLWGLFLLSLEGSAPPPILTAPSVEENIRQAGLDGEVRVQHKLFAVIPESWEVISGYHNSKGETDFILVTPNGLMVIEVKSYSGWICCLGDDWFALKPVRGGWIKNPIQDGGRRSPNQQVNAVADSLEGYFVKFGPNLGVGRVKRAVVFAAQNSGIHQVEQPGVELVCTLDSLTQECLLDVLPPRESPLDIGKLLKMIKKDHQFHETQRRNRKM